LTLVYSAAWEKNSFMLLRFLQDPSCPVALCIVVTDPFGAPELSSLDFLSAMRVLSLCAPLPLCFLKHTAVAPGQAPVI